MWQSTYLTYPLILLWLTPVLSFILNPAVNLSSVCFANDKSCTCEEYYRAEFLILLDVVCENRNLTSFPDFTHISNQVYYQFNAYTVDVYNNNIKSIPGGTFYGFGPVNQAKNRIHLDMQYNQISQIANNAFLGIENMHSSMNFTGNLLTTLPVALNVLKQLTDLSLQMNPIMTFDANVVNHISGSLVTLEIDYSSLNAGKSLLQNLRHLYAMTIHDVSAAVFSSDALQFFQRYERDLTVKGTDFHTLPCTLLSGPNKDHFFVTDAKNLSARNFVDCPANTALNLIGMAFLFGTLTEFPNILRFTPKLRALNLANNSIQSIDDSFIPVHTKLFVLNLSNNRLRTIPASFKRLTDLHFLYLYNNNLQTISAEFLTPQWQDSSYMYSLCLQGNNRSVYPSGQIYCNDHLQGEFLYFSSK